MPRCRRSSSGSRPSFPSLLLAASLVACGAPTADSPSDEASGARLLEPVLTLQSTGSDVRFQAVSVVSDRVAWISGVESTYAVTVDGGVTWSVGRLPVDESLELRDVQAFDADRAVVLTSGPGESSRVLITDDGGASWRETFRNLDPDGFFNCFDFDARGRGWLVGDPLDGRLPVLTSETGQEWRLFDELPVPLEGEAGFAASGTCLLARGEGGAVLLATGGGTSRLHRWSDGAWSAATLPIPASTSSAGATSVARSFSGVLAVGGGDVAERELSQQTLAEHRGGAWVAVQGPPFVGPIFGLAWGRAGTSEVLFAAGPAGLAVRRDGEWQALDGGSTWAVSTDPSGRIGVAVGPEGRVARVEWRPSDGVE